MGKKGRWPQLQLFPEQQATALSREAETVKQSFSRTRITKWYPDCLYLHSEWLPLLPLY